MRCATHPDVETNLGCSELICPECIEQISSTKPLLMIIDYQSIYYLRHSAIMRL